MRGTKIDIFTTPFCVEKCLQFKRYSNDNLKDIYFFRLDHLYWKRIHLFVNFDIQPNWYSMHLKILFVSKERERVRDRRKKRRERERWANGVATVVTVIDWCLDPTSGTSRKIFIEQYEK